MASVITLGSRPSYLFLISHRAGRLGDPTNMIETQFQHLGKRLLFNKLLVINYGDYE
ncbi:hypothetical protein D3C85_159060 [compost metagenome]